MRIIITAATMGEWMPAFLAMDPLYTSESKRMKVQFHQTGVGQMATGVSLTKLLMEEKPDLVLQVGIAGCFHSNIPLGTVLAVKEEMLADLGVEEGGVWKDIFDLKLEKSSYPPFEKRKLLNPFCKSLNYLNLPLVSAVTVNEISTQKKRIASILEKYKPSLESMEGAALHYTCQLANIPFLQIRAVSNYVGERNKANWKIKESIEQLNLTLLQYIEAAYQQA